MQYTPDVRLELRSILLALPVPHNQLPISNYHHLLIPIDVHRLSCVPRNIGGLDERRSITSGKINHFAVEFLVLGLVDENTSGHVFA